MIKTNNYLDKIAIVVENTSTKILEYNKNIKYIGINNVDNIQCEKYEYFFYDDYIDIYDRLHCINKINISTIKNNTDMFFNKPTIILNKKYYIICFLIKLGFKIIIFDIFDNLDHTFCENMFRRFDVNILEISNSKNGILNINENELTNIINYTMLFLYSSCDANYTIANLFTNFLTMMNNYEKNLLFLKNGIKIITSEKIYKQMYVMQNNNCGQDKLFLQFIKNNLYNKIILLGFFKGEKEFLNFKKDNKNCVVSIYWDYDPHKNTYIENTEKKIDIITFDTTQTYICKLFDYYKIDYLVGPRTLFENTGMNKYEKKIVDLFYMFNTDYYEKLDYLNYETRQNKIIMSGCVYIGYPTREEFIKLKSKSEEFDKLIDIIKHPGYVNGNCTQMTGLNYYKKLSEYKGAFCGHHKKPANYIVGKHIEILMCGCLGFFQKHPQFESFLGLKAFVHYIPCSDENDKIITDFNFYNNWINSEDGKKIAKTGSEYVREKFGEKYMQNYIDFFKSI